MDDGTLTAREGNPLPGLEWWAESLRVTTFVQPIAGHPQEAWWAGVAGVQPEAITKQPRLGILQMEGVFEHCRLVLRTELGRVDWLLFPLDPADETLESVPFIGGFMETSDLFRRLLTPWFTDAGCPPASRVAFAGTLVSPVMSLADGYARLACYLGDSVKLDAEGSQDFLYQVNRRRAIDLDGRTCWVNRLSKWSVATLTTMRPDLSGSSIVSPLARYFARLEFDTNTEPGAIEDANGVQQARILAKLVEMASEVAREGDVP
ncbi:MAG: hypothetical protein ACYC5Q_10845 [Thermoleophilia bacterium]